MQFKKHFTQLWQVLVAIRNTRSRADWLFEQVHRTAMRFDAMQRGDESATSQPPRVYGRRNAAWKPRRIIWSDKSRRGVPLGSYVKLTTTTNNRVVARRHVGTKYDASTVTTRDQLATRSGYSEIICDRILWRWSLHHTLFATNM